MSINVNNVKSLFELFSGESANSKWLPVIYMACLEVGSILLPTADETDTRIEFLAASVANYRAQEIKLSSGKSEYEYIGEMKSGGSAAASLRGAASLMREYVKMCRDMIKTDTFIFEAVPPKEG